MNKARSTLHVLGVCIALAGVLFTQGNTVWAQDGGFTQEFRIEEREFSTTGRNPYLILEPGYRLTLEGEDEGEAIVLQITVLDETEVVDGVVTRVVEERETVDGVLAEVSRNFFAICTKTNDVFYFGEDVDNFDDEGNFVDHDSAWRAGVDDARPGVVMPGLALLGARYHQETAPGEAMDRAEIQSLTETQETAAGTFEHCLKIEESTPLEPGVVEYKVHAPGIGLVRDADLTLTEVEGLQIFEFEPFEQESEFTENFLLETCEFASTGRGTYFVLEPGHTVVLEGEEDEETVSVTITVLNDTEAVDGVATRVVEERETADGALTEISRNFFAVCTRTNSLFYFGEDVDNYDDEGNIEDHEGSWRAGVDGAKPGLMIAATPMLGSRYQQETAPEIAMDRGEDISLAETVVTPAGTFANCLLIRETTALEEDEVSVKQYGPGIGIVQDDELLLTAYSSPSAVEDWELLR